MRDASPGPTGGRGSERSRSGSVWFWPVVLLLAGGGGWLWSTGQLRQVPVLSGLLGSNATATAKGKAGPAPAPVQAEVVRRTDFLLAIAGLGAVQASSVVTVRARVDGQIEKIGFTEGQSVKAGDVLAELDPAPFKAALAQATAKLAQDEANKGNLERDLDRTTKLMANGNATRQLYDQQTSNVAQMTAQMLADRAAIESAQVQLNYATIKAPFSGQAGIRLIDGGNIVRAADQTGIVTIAQLEPIAVIFSAPESRLPEIRKALANGGEPKVTAFTADGKKALAEGVLKVVDNQVDAATGTIRLKAIFENKEHALWPGQSVSTRLVVGKLSDVLVVSDNVIQRGPTGLFAYVITAENKAKLTPLVVGAADAGQVVIEKGLAAGERVVSAGHYKVLPNGPVTVIDTTPKRQASAERGAGTGERQ